MRSTRNNTGSKNSMSKRHGEIAFEVQGRRLMKVSKERKKNWRVTSRGLQSQVLMEGSQKKLLLFPNHLKDTATEVSGGQQKQLNTD